MDKRKSSQCVTNLSNSKLTLKTSSTEKTNTNQNLNNSIDLKETSTKSKYSPDSSKTQKTNSNLSVTKSKNNLGLSTNPVEKSKFSQSKSSTNILFFDDEKKDTLTISKALFIHSGNPGVMTDVYHLGLSLGQGEEGTLRKAIHKITGHARTIKIIKKKDQEITQFENEVKILSKLSHPNIVQIFEYFEDNTNFYIVSEFCPGGELFEKISEKGQFSEKDAAFILKQILSAVWYLHQNEIVHRDLRPENILLDNKTDKPTIKLVDFGLGMVYNVIFLARFYNSRISNKIKGSPYYTSPEAINGVYDYKSDIWSIGVIFYVLLCGNPPFIGENNLDVIKAIKKGKYEFPSKEWCSVSEEAKDLIKNMLNVDKSLRFSAESCLSHKFFKKYETIVKRTPLIDSSMIKMKKYTVKNI